MAIKLPEPSVSNVEETSTIPESDNESSDSDFDYEEACMMETQRVRESLEHVNWKAIIDLQLAVNYIEMVDRYGRNTSTIDTVKDVAEFLRDLGITLTGMTLTWPELNCQFHALTYDIMHTVKYWYCELDTAVAQWFCNFHCPQDVNREHLLKICNFLIAGGLKVYYIPLEGRMIQRLVLFISSPSWDYENTKLRSKLRPIDQLAVQ